MKKTVSFFLILALILSLAACGKNENGSEHSNAAEGGKTAVTETATQKTITPAVKKSVEEDDDLGLMNVKIQDTEGLSDVEKLLVNYFDNDYFNVFGLERLKRFPKIYRGSQISIEGYVFKTIESNDDSYTFLMKTFNDDDPMSEVWRSGAPEYFVVKGEQNDERIIEGDNISVYGKFTGNDPYTVDGKTYNIPTILVNKYTYFTENITATSSSTDYKPLFTFEEIRSMAKYIFGEDITIYDAYDIIKREDHYYHSDSGAYADKKGDLYIVELENQSNANFTKYGFDAGTAGRTITDEKSTETEKRFITVSADFEHFYLQIYNSTLKTYTLSCYDRDLKKLWSKDFDDTNSATLDYTANHIYLVANGYMYIIDAETGEESVPKKYVGETNGIRKLRDGVLLLRKGPSDAITKTDLAGNVLWSVNTDTEAYYHGNDFQLVDGNYVVSYYDDFIKTETYIQLGNQVGMVISPDGEIIYKGAIN